MRSSIQDEMFFKYIPEWLLVFLQRDPKETQKFDLSMYLTISEYGLSMYLVLR